jgi:galactokinase
VTTPTTRAGGRCPWPSTTGERRGVTVELRSDAEPGVVRCDLHGSLQPESPRWGRYVAAVVQQVRPVTGLAGMVRSTLPVGRGLSSSAALEVGVALALGADRDPIALARRCRAAEHLATGVQCGIMDQLTITSGRAGHALLLDCHTLEVEPVAVPGSFSFVVVDTGERRSLDGTAYEARRAECAQAEAQVGPLRSSPDVGPIDDAVVRARARHVVTEIARVRAFAAAMRAGDAATAGRLMIESHESLRDDFAVSTPTLDATVAQLLRAPGVRGARLTGAGFGGSVVALCDADAPLPPGAVRVQPSGGASCSTPGASAP